MYRDHNMLREFFYLQKSDRQAIMVLLSVIIIALVFVFGVGSHHTTTSVSPNSDKEYSRGYYSKDGKHLYYNIEGRQAELFPFDPNTADSTELLRLGLAPFQVRNIYHYRAKGGVFHSANDFARLYGLTRKQYRMLEPYIQISSDYLPASDLYQSRGFVRDTMRLSPVHHISDKLKPGETILLNASDTTLLKKVPGIGSGYAKAIVNLRNRYGGLYDPRQLLDISEFPVDALKYFRVDLSGITKININKLSVNQLRRHPYINFYQAKAIFDYRRTHGPIHDLRELANHPDFPPAEIERLQPYVEY